uniref:UDP-glycosyltransferases domain-containing protein n=1 Tax=Gossypium raimondii TaxID=29730 RepID=A0A0D2RJ55_GOSRA|nr:hypothetical protein B456_003G084700 [Gossypium raimondii]
MVEAVVLYPSPPIGHLLAMVELGKLLLSHRPSLSIHILIATPPYQAESTAPYIAAVSSTIPSIVFHKLPKVTLLPSTDVAHHEFLTFEVLRLSNPNVHETLLSISKDYKVHAFIMDFFCTVAFKVAVDLSIPPYFLYTSGVATLSSFFYLPTLHNNTTKSFKELNLLLNIPGVPPVPSADMPKPVLDRNDQVYHIFINNSMYLPKSAGIIINSFESLEPRAIKAIRDGLCVPDGPTPPLYCIGPLIADVDRRSGARSNVAGEGAPDDCLMWLDKQPSKSVVFLCFGSLGLFSAQQLKEIAEGLERSEQRFNRVLLVEEMKIALPMVESETGFVDSSEVEKRVRELMEWEQGKLVRERTVAMKHAAKAAMSKGGSSRLALAKLFESWKKE